MKEAKINELYNRCKEELKKQTNNEEDLIIGNGNFETDVVFVTEYLDEDLFDKEYVNEIREGFHNILKTLEITLDDIYVTDIVKYSPYHIDVITGEKIKRLPEKRDIDFFLPYLLEELSIISPKIVVTLGDLTLQVLLDDPNLRVKEEHGIIRDFFIKGKKMKLIPLKNPNTRNYNMNSLSDDLKNLKQLIEENQKNQINENEIKDTKEKINNHNDSIKQAENDITSVKEETYNEAAANEALVNDVAANDEVVNEAAANDEVVNEAAANEVLVNDVAANDEVVNEAAANEAVVNEAVINDALVNDVAENDTVANDKVVNDEIVTDEITNNEVVNIEGEDNKLTKSEEHNEVNITDLDSKEDNIITKEQEEKQVNITKPEDKEINENNILRKEQEQNNSQPTELEDETNNNISISSKDEKNNNNEIIEIKNADKKNIKIKNRQIRKTNDLSDNTTFKKQVIIVYGGEGYADDPTIVIIDRISEVFKELNIRVVRLDLYKEDYNIKAFFEELEKTKLIVLATTVEWFGIGGYMQTFLDQCWKYGNKTLFEKVFLFGIVISRQGYERDTYNNLIKSWEILGGIEGVSLCANIKTSVDLETNLDLLDAIDKKTQEFYRIAYKNNVVLPTSIRENRRYIEIDVDTNSYLNNNDIDDELGILDVEPTSLDTTYDKYLEQQKKDIKDITDILLNKLSQKTNESSKKETDIIMEKYIGTDEEVEYNIQWNIIDKPDKNIIIKIDGEQINSYFGEDEDINLNIQSQYQILDKIINGKMTIQRAFMTGDIKAKGDFTILYKIDKLFKFR